MSDIKIMVDSAADLSPERLREYNIGIIPLLSVFGEKSYVIGDDISNAQFYDMLTKSKSLPKTSQTPYAVMYDILLEESKKHETIIYFTLSSNASGQNHSAQLVREDIIENDNPKADIRIVDSLSFSYPIGRAAIEAARLVQQGCDADEVIEKSTLLLSKLHAFLLVSDLMFLEKGGRMRKTAAIVGSLLDIKPVLTIANGLMEVEAKLRGKKKVYKKLCEMIDEYEGFDRSYGEFLIIHSDKQMADDMAAAVREVLDENAEISFAEFGPLIGTNTGGGAMAVIFKLL